MVAAVAELLMFKLGHCEIQFRPLRDKNWPLRDKKGSAHKTYRDLGPIQETWRDPLDQKSAPGPDCVKTFFLPQKLHATGDDPRRHDGLSIFLLYRVRSQPGRKLGPR